MTIKTAQQIYSSPHFIYLCTYYKYGHKYTFGYKYVKNIFNQCKRSPVSSSNCCQTQILREGYSKHIPILVQLVKLYQKVL